MKAAVLRAAKSFFLESKSIPSIGENEALIRVRYAGICGSDLNIYHGLHPTAQMPVVLCHEILGTIEQLPPDYAGEYRQGDRVLINPIVSCGGCDACRRGNDNVCLNLKLTGIHLDGGFAEYARVYTHQLVKVPDALADKTAAMGEPFAVSRHVNRRADVRKDEKVLIIGAGFIGIAVALGAAYLGAKPVVAEIKDYRKAMAERVGLRTINPAEVNLIDFMKAETDGAGFDVVIDAAGARETALMLPDLCRTHGRIVPLGLSRLPYDFRLGVVSFREETLVGTRLYRPEDFEAGVKMLQALSEKMDLEVLVSDVYPLEDIVEGFNRAVEGRNEGKILIDCR